MKHCEKCEGKGYIKAYAGIKSGVCFQCKGKQTLKEGEKTLSEKSIHVKSRLTYLIKEGIKKSYQLKSHTDTLKSIKDNENGKEKENAIMLVQDMINDTKDDLQGISDEIESLKHEVSEYFFNETKKQEITNFNISMDLDRIQLEKEF